MTLTAVINWMFRFGDYGPKVSQDPTLKPAVDDTLKNIHRALADEERIIELTLATIVAAAAQEVPLAVFRDHFDKLHGFGLVEKGINIYGTEQRLSATHKPVLLLYAIRQIVTNGCCIPSLLCRNRHAPR